MQGMSDLAKSSTGNSPTNQSATPVRGSHAALGATSRADRVGEPRMTSSSTLFARSPPAPASRRNQPTPTRTQAQTPTQTTIFNSSTNRAGPSPAYVTNLRSRHSLYGTDDRVVLDLGSKVWKAGFSSETQPRVVISVNQLCKPILDNHDSIWDLSSNTGSSSNSNSNSPPSSKISSSLISDAISIGLRRIFFDHLMIDPKQRKIILIENPLIPINLRSEIGIILFDQLHVPSISFTPSSVLVLMACGLLTGLVIDVGNLETSVLPVYMSRPLFPMIKSTTRAGARLSSRLKNLLLRFAQYLPVPKFGQSSLSTNVPRMAKPTQVPINLLTSSVIEDIKTRLLFVSPDRLQSDDQSTSPSETTTTESQVLDEEYSEIKNHRLLDTLERVYKKSTDPDTQDVVYKLPTLQQSQSNPRAPCVGVLRIPAWIRERASEILFNPTQSDRTIEEEEDDESLSIPEVILESLLKLPIDLRRQIIKNLIISGGGAMLPGFVERLKVELLTILEEFKPPTSSSNTPNQSLTTNLSKKKKQELEKWISSRRKFSPLSLLSEELAILNMFEPSDHQVQASMTTTTPSTIKKPRPPRFQMNLLAWIGGSLAGAMRIGGQEIIRERWDSIVESSLVSQELDLHQHSQSGLASLNDDDLDEDDENEEQIEHQRKLIGLKIASSILPDWAVLSFS